MKTITLALLILSTVGMAFDVTGPIPKLDTENIDLGSILPDTQLKKDLTVYNIGKSDLILSKVQASCNCLVPYDCDKKISAGEKGAVRLSVNVGSTVGPKKYFVRVGTNSEKESVLTWTIRYRVVDDLEPTPNELLFQLSDKEPTRIEKVVQVRNISNSKYLLDKVRSSSDVVRYNTDALPIEIPPHSEITLSTYVDSGEATIGKTFGFLRLQFSNTSNSKEIVVPYVVEKRGSFYISLPQIFSGSISPGAQKSVSFTVRRTSGYEMPLLPECSVSLPVAGIHSVFKVEPNGKDANVQLQVSIPDSIKEVGIVRGSILIRDKITSEAMTLPVSMLIRESREGGKETGVEEKSTSNTLAIEAVNAQEVRILKRNVPNASELFVKRINGGKEIGFGMLMRNEGVWDSQDVTFPLDRPNRIYMFMDPLFDTKGPMKMISSAVPISQPRHNILWEIEPAEKAVLSLDMDGDGQWDEKLLLSDLLSLMNEQKNER